MDLERLIDFDTAKNMLDHVGWQVPGIDPLPKNSFPAEEMAAHAARDSAASLPGWVFDSVDPPFSLVFLNLMTFYGISTLEQVHHWSWLVSKKLTLLHCWIWGNILRGAKGKSLKPFRKWPWMAGVSATSLGATDVVKTGHVISGGWAGWFCGANYIYYINPRQSIPILLNKWDSL